MDDSEQPRLNPFVFPSDTDFRFVLLVVAVLGSSMFVYNWLSNSLPGSRQALLDTAERCLALAPLHDVGPASDLFSLGAELTADQAEFMASAQAYAECVAPYNEALAGWIAGGVAIMLAVAVGVYWVFPSRKIRRDRLAPLPVDDVPEVAAYLSALCGEAELRRPPMFLWNPLNQVPSGVAFGHLGQYYVALNGGLVRRFYTDRPAFRAVVLHELAHLRNADVDKTYFALAIAAAFGLAALLPFGIAMIGEPLEVSASVLWRVLVLSGLVYLTLNAVLRAREAYADVRASIWDGTSTLRRVLQALSHRPATRWTRPLRVHPSVQDRLSIVDDTRGLFRMGFWEAFAAGLAIAVALPSVQTLLSLVTTRMQQSTAAPLLTALVFAPLVVGVIGLGAWRSAYAGLARGEAAPGVAPLALGLSLGLVLGQAIALQSTIDELIGGTDESAAAVFAVAWGGLVLLSVVLFLRWIVASASAWLDVAQQFDSPRWAYAPALLVGTGTLAVWLGVLFFTASFAWLLEAAPGLLFSLFLAGLLVVALPLLAWWLFPPAIGLLAFASLWALPLAARLFRQSARPGAATWAFLGSAREMIAPDADGRPRLRPPLESGLVAAGAFCILLLAARLAVRIALSDDVRDSDAFVLAFFGSQVLVAILMQAAVAFFVARKTRLLGSVLGLFAAFVAGCGMSAGLLGLNLLFGGTAEPAFVQQVFWMVLGGGAVVVLPSALLGGARAGQRTGLSSSPEPVRS